MKRICLRHCRSPMGFLIQSWRPGAMGAFRMGLKHGSYCLGCCWFLMGLLFFGGVMNLFWIAGLSAFVLLEKVLPLGHWIGRLGGIAAVAWGLLLFAAAMQPGDAALAGRYRFETVEVRAIEPGKTAVAVRLVHRSDRRPVNDAVIDDAKTDMGPDGMPEMSGKVTPLPADGPVVHRFLIETGMAGKWQLELGASVPGEGKVIRGVIIYDVAQ